jgi:hypothetical protein
METIQSTYLKISPFAVIEWSYNTDEKLISENSFYKLSNIDKKIDVFINDNRSSSFTKNVLDHTFIEIEGGRVGHCDIDRTFELHELDPNIDLDTDLNIPTNLSVKYDTAKIHILAGYNLQDLDGIGLRVLADKNSGSRGILSSLIYELTDNILISNSKPFTIGEQIYDKYIEIKVPSLSDINQKFYTLSSPTTKQLGYYLTSDNTGFKRESPIILQFFTFRDFEELDNRLTYFYTKTVEISLPQIDPNSLITNTIQESDEGDYFEYFTMYDGEFIADYISLQNSLGYTMTVINELRVYENYSDTTRKLTDENIFIQDSDFDVPKKYRPIISNSAYSFILEYTSRIVNQTDNTQVVRISSVVCDTPIARKYGQSLNQIKIKDTALPFKLYNKLASPEYNLNITKVSPPIQQYKVDVIRYTQEYSILISADNKIPNITTQNTIPNIIMGNGLGLIYISEYDNYIRIYFHNKASNLEIQKLILSNLIKEEDTLDLVFFNNTGGKIYITGNKATLTENNIIFNIPKSTSSKLKDFTNKNFNIVYKNSLKEEINLYSGKYTNDFSDYQVRVNKIISDELDNKVKEITATYNDILKKITDLNYNPTATRIS